jgi:hypothetical protein
VGEGSGANSLSYMGHPLWGSWIRVKRADQGIRELNAAAKEYVDSRPFTVEFGSGRRRAPYIAVYPAIARFSQEPPLPVWGAIIGEVVHNLRSAIDHLVWKLSDKHSGPAPPHPLPRGSPWSRIEFPIFPSARDFAKGAPGKLWAIDPALVRRIRAVQPFTGPKPRRSPLWLLHELSNIDKHRHPPVVGLLVNVTPTGFVSPVRGQVLMTRAGIGLDPIQDGTVIFRAGVLRNPWQGAPVIYFQLLGSVDMALAKGPPGHGQRTIETLINMRDKVTNALLLFDDQFGTP